jgi:two-component system, chemotaxis family, chemotaxis protein CheY
VGFQETPILIIDDSNAVRTVLKDILVERGFREVSTAGSVAEAQEMYDEKRHPIVFLDLLMPEASGLRFARYALDADPYCKIILITALPPSNEGVITAISEGAYDILQKPIRPAEMAAMLRKLERDVGARVGAARDDVSYS